MTRVVFTCGDVNGIGPEIALKAFSKIFKKKNSNNIVFICPQNVFDFYYKLTKSTFKVKYFDNKNLSSDRLNLIFLPNSKLTIGKPTVTSGKTSYNSIIKAIKLVNSYNADLIVTTPISKEAFKLAGINYPGHTELLAKSENSRKYQMTFLSEKIKAGLLTIHSPISKVSHIISKQKIIDAIKLLNQTAINDLGIDKPTIAVLGLNPHAGENGLIGKEEIKIIFPAIESLKNKINVDGPFVPDAFWGNKDYKKFDMILGMYHDQILIPFKLLNFSKGVNYTAGLKLIRTSPDHGTAFDIAGKNIADESSLMQAYRYAITIHKNRNSFLANQKTS
jgi:4-hydroxythreonine-4-phosphate dehydrogenase